MSRQGLGMGPGAEVMRAAKQAVRTAVEARLALMSEEDKVHQSEQVLQKLLAHPAFTQARSVAVFLSTPREVDTKAVVAALLSSGRACFVPRYAFGREARERRARGGAGEDGGMEMVRLVDMEDLAALPRTPWGIPQPRMDEARGQPGVAGEPPLDLVLVPGVAFTTAGHRLGHGKGYYDKYLAALAPPRPTTIALAFRQQLVERLPTTQLDVTMDHVLAADS